MDHKNAGAQCNSQDPVSHLIEKETISEIITDAENIALAEELIDDLFDEFNDFDFVEKFLSFNNNIIEQNSSQKILYRVRHK